MMKYCIMTVKWALSWQDLAIHYLKMIYNQYMRNCSIKIKLDNRLYLHCYFIRWDDG